MIYLVEAETPWESSERFNAVVTEGIAKRLDAKLRIELGASSELFLPELGEAVRPVDVASDAEGVTITAHAPPRSDQMWMNTIKRAVRDEVMDLPLEEARQEVESTDPLAVLPTRAGS